MLRSTAIVLAKLVAERVLLVATPPHFAKEPDGQRLFFPGATMHRLELQM